MMWEILAFTLGILVFLAGFPMVFDWWCRKTGWDPFDYFIDFDDL